MSFDIFFQPCRFGSQPIRKTNPFTGETQSVLPNEPLSPAELAAVRRVLDTAAVQQADDAGHCVVRAGDGGEAEVFCGNLAGGCMVALRGITPGLLQLLLDLLKAGNWSMVPAMEDAVAIVPSPQAVQSVPDDFPPTVVCDSAEDLGRLLSEGFTAWKKYRDQVVGGEEPARDEE